MWWSKTGRRLELEATKSHRRVLAAKKRLSQKRSTGLHLRSR